MNPDLLKILRCPETRQSLSLAPAEKIIRINTLIRNGRCKNHSGNPVTEPLQEALIREDGQKLYPVRNNVPVLLQDESIACGITE